MGSPVRYDWRQTAPALAIFAVALALRLYDITAQPFWLDELTTLRRARLPVGALFADSFTNMHLPTYYLGIHFLLGLGEGETALRLPSALFGAATAALAAMIGRRLGGPVAAWTAGLLVALSPLQVEFGQEARANALLGLLVVLALMGLLSIASDPVAASRNLARPDGLRRAWALYALGTGGALAVLNSGVFWLAASAAALVFILLACDASVRRGLFVNVGIALAVILCLWLPWLPFVSGPVARAAIAGFWIPKLTAENVFSTLGAVYLFRVSDPIDFDLEPATFPLAAAVMAVLLPALAAFGAWRLRRRKPELVVLALATLLLPAALLLISTVKPLFISRYLLWAAVPFFILVSAGVASLPRMPARLSAAVLLLLSALNLWQYFGAELKPQWGNLVRHVADRAGPCDVVYLEGDVSHYVYDLTERGLVPSGWRSRRVGVPAEAAAAIAAGGHVWAAVGKVAYGPRTSEDVFLRSLAGLGRPAQTIRFGQDVVLYRFDPKAGPACGGRQF